MFRFVSQTHRKAADPPAAELSRIVSPIPDRRTPDFSINPANPLGSASGRETYLRSMSDAHDSHESQRHQVTARILAMQDFPRPSPPPVKSTNLWIACLPFAIVHTILAFFLLRLIGVSSWKLGLRVMVFGAAVITLYTLNLALFAILLEIVGKRRR
jgi:hypothetical protein